jgi:hypothetical protein
MLNLLLAPWRTCSNAARHFMTWSLAARTAWAVAFLQFFMVLFTVVVLLTTGGPDVFEAWWTPTKAVALLLLMGVIPMLVYYSARLWFHHETARWPDIDKAWKEALIELDRQGVDVRSTPLFFVLGADGDTAEHNLFGKPPFPLDVRAAPAGSAPLHVYGGVEGIFVCLATIGQTCRVNLQDGSPEHPHAALTAVERADASDRLRSLCERIRNARQPVAPANGILALVSTHSDDQTRLTPVIGAALGDDLITITSTCGLRMPLTVVGTGIETLAGFDTLLKRLPSETQTLVSGDIFPIGRTASATELSTLAIAATGRLADEAGSLMLDPHSLAHSDGNRSMIGLMCRLRLHVAPLLQGIMQRGLDSAAHHAGSPMLAGCYLLPTPKDLPAINFTKDLFARVIEVQGDLEWTPKQLKRNRRSARIARGLAVLNTLLLAAWIAVLWWRLSR